MPERAFKDLHTVLSVVLKDCGLQEKVAEKRILQNWSLIMGTKISKMCKPLSLQNGELTIRAKDKFWRDELAHRQQDLLNLLDKQIERSLVKKINII